MVPLVLTHSRIKPMEVAVSRTNGIYNVQQKATQRVNKLAALTFSLTWRNSWRGKTNNMPRGVRNSTPFTNKDSPHAPFSGAWSCLRQDFLRNIRHFSWVPNLGLFDQSHPLNFRTRVPFAWFWTKAYVPRLNSLCTEWGNRAAHVTPMLSPEKTWNVHSQVTLTGSMLVGGRVSKWQPRLLRPLRCLNSLKETGKDAVKSRKSTHTIGKKIRFQIAISKKNCRQCVNLNKVPALQRTVHLETTTCKLKVAAAFNQTSQGLCPITSFGSKAGGG